MIARQIDLQPSPKLSQFQTSFLSFSTPQKFADDAHMANLSHSDTLFRIEIMDFASSLSPDSSIVILWSQFGERHHSQEIHQPFPIRGSIPGLTHSRHTLFVFSFDTKIFLLSARIPGRFISGRIYRLDSGVQARLLQGHYSLENDLSVLLPIILQTSCWDFKLRQLIIDSMRSG